MPFGTGLRTILAGSLLCSAAGVGAAVVSASPASATTAATLYVSAGGTGDCTTLVNACSSIQTAVAAAETVAYSSDDVTIDVAAGTYMENVTIAASSLNSLTIAGAGATATTVNGRAAGSVFSVSGGAVTLLGLTITNGSRPNGAGIFNSSTGTLNVIDSILSGNATTYGGGGAIFCDSNGTVNVIDSTLSGNFAGGDGGAIFNNLHGTLNVIDSTLSGNRASINGGSIYNFTDGPVNVIDSTLSGNTASLGGGIFQFGASAVNLGASIIANNTGGNCSSAVTDLGYNLTDDASCGFGLSTDHTVTSGSLNFGSLANNGGPTDTLMPLPGSPAIGAVPLTTTLNSVPVCPRTDQRGVVSNGPCTIGAVQVNIQTISFTSSAPSATVGGSYTPTASLTSGLAVSITVDASSSSVCSINTSGVVSFLTPGTCTLDANQAGDANYAAAPQAQQSVTVSAPGGGGSPQLIVQMPLTLTSPSGVVGTPLTLTSSGGSGTGALSFLLTSPGSATCTLHGDTLSATSTGTCTLLVFKTGDATYLAAISSPTTVTFTPSPLTPGSLRLISIRGVVGTPLTLMSRDGSGIGTVSYALKSAGPATCTLHGDTLMAKKAGTCTLNLSEADTSTYHASSGVATVRFVEGLNATRVEGSVTVGTTSLVTITGTGFYDKPTMKSDDAHTSAVVIHDHGTALVVRVRVRPGAATGWHEFTIILANGHSCRVRYLTK